LHQPLAHDWSTAVQSEGVLQGGSAGMNLLTATMVYSLAWLPHSRATDTPQVCVDSCTALKTRSPAKANGCDVRSTDRYTSYPPTDAFTIRDSVVPE